MMKLKIGSFGKIGRLLAVSIPVLAFSAVASGAIGRGEIARLALQTEDFDRVHSTLIPELQQALKHRRFDQVISAAEPFLDVSSELQELSARAIAGKSRVENQKRLDRAKAEVTQHLKAGELQAAWELAKQFDEPEFVYRKEQARDQYAAQQEPVLFKQLRETPAESIPVKLSLLQNLSELRPKNLAYRKSLETLQLREKAMSSALVAAPESQLREAQRTVREFEDRLLAIDRQVKPMRNAASVVWKALAKRRITEKAATGVLAQGAKTFRAAMNETAQLEAAPDGLPADVIEQIHTAAATLTDSYNCFSLALDKGEAYIGNKNPDAQTEHKRWVDLSEAATLKSATALVQAKLKVGLPVGKAKNPE